VRAAAGTAMAPCHWRVIEEVYAESQARPWVIFHMRRSSHLQPFRTFQRPPNQLGIGSDRIVWKPGVAAITLGIEFTVMEAVAMSPCTPPDTLE
jgi:hypothetical protein